VDIAKGAKEAEGDQAKKTADLKLTGVTALGSGSFVFELLRYLHFIK